MSDDNHGKWGGLRLKNLTFNRKRIKKRMQKAEGATVRHARRFVIKRWDNVRDVQRHVALWILGIGIIIGSTGLQLMWNQKNYQTTTPAQNTTYAEAVLGSVDNLNPLYSSSSVEQSASRLIFSSLLKYDTTGHLSYDIATNVKTDAIQRKYTVSIRPDIVWHDGVRLTAKDVAFTVNLMKDPNVRSSITGWEGIDVKALDDKTIQFSLQSPYGAFQHALTFAILPEHILSKIQPISIRESGFSQNPVGSGPFKLSFIQKNEAGAISVVNMIRNDDYYGQAPKLQRFQLHSFESSDAILSSLSKNEVNAAMGLTSVDIPRIDSKKYHVVTQPVQSGVFALLNTKSQILQDVNIRKALRLATDTSAIRQKLAKGTPGLDIPIIPNLLQNGDLHSPSYDLRAARTVMSSAGWNLNSSNILTKGGRQLKLTVITIKNTELERVLEVLAGQWRNLGVVVDTKSVDPNDTNIGVVQNILQPRAFDVLLYQLSIGADPDVYAYWHSSQTSTKGLNFSNYSNSITDDALLSARTRSESDLRNAKYLTFIKQWLNDVPAIGLYQSAINYVESRTTHAFNTSNTLVAPVDRYSDVYDWAVGNQNVYKTP